MAGLINIITKKNMDEGYNGSLNSRYNSIYGPGININATWKQKKFGVNGYIGGNFSPSTVSTKNGYTNNITSPVVSNFLQEGTRSLIFTNKYGTLELSYEIDSLNLLTASIETYFGDNTQGNT
ncbi:hypothetical protein [Parasediminibacterium sp. JCM 36343]|uniref:hypothetical protein n=1 Tax=Parasediminibacterium sp. JCM 36343 TaxID=3374279 RepID=UPI003978A826